MKVGLVLSGGGARGAYEVGVIQALARMGVEPEVVSGASIGALNGAFISEARSMEEAAKKLKSLWMGLDNADILKLNSQTSIQLLGIIALHNLLKVGHLKNLGRNDIINVLPGSLQNDFAVLDESSFDEILGQALDVEKIYHGREFFVSVFPTSNSILSGVGVDLIRAFLNEKSEFIRVKDYDRNEILEILKASAALPIAFKAKKISGKRFRDGGLGGRLTAQGNTPIEPLIREKCTHAIVVIPGDGVLWNRYEWEDISSLEIRPSRLIQNRGSFKTLIDFSQKEIKELIDLGEKDAMRSLQKFYRASKAVSELRSSRENLHNLMQRLRM